MTEKQRRLKLKRRKTFTEFVPKYVCHENFSTDPMEREFVKVRRGLTGTFQLWKTKKLWRYLIINIFGLEDSG